MCSLEDAYSFHLPVGTRDNTPLPKDTIPISWDTDRLARWCWHNWKALQSEAKADYRRSSRKVGTRAEGSEVCWVFCANTERVEKCLWRGNSCSLGTTRACQEEEMHNLVRNSNLSSFTNIRVYDLFTDRLLVNRKKLGLQISLSMVYYNILDYYSTSYYTQWVCYWCCTDCIHWYSCCEHLCCIYLHKQYSYAYSVGKSNAV